MTPLILIVLGLVLLLVALAIYPSTTELPPPPYSRVSVLTKFRVSFISYAAVQVSPAIAEIEIVVVRPLPRPPAGTPTATLIVSPPLGTTFRDCAPPACRYVTGILPGSTWSKPLVFNLAGYASAVFYVNASRFGVSFNGINAFAAIPEVFYSGPGQPTFLAGYDIPSASSYDWSSFPTAAVNNSSAGWTEAVVTSDTAGRIAAGINHAGQSSNDYKAFIAGALIGLAGAAILSAIQEALHAFDWTLPFDASRKGSTT